MDETVLAQSVSSDRSTITDSNNRGNAGRDIINNYNHEDFYKGKVPRQIDIIKSQRIVMKSYSVRLTECRTRWKNISINSQKHNR